MAKEKKKNIEKKMEKKKENKTSCADNLCPIHGKKKLKIRGRIFEGKVIKKLPGRVTIAYERINKVRKYERYEKRVTKLHARLPDCMKDKIEVGDRIRIGETRPVSKIIHFVVLGKSNKENSEGRKK